MTYWLIASSEKGARSGIPNYVDAVSKDLARADRKAVMGFTGKNLEAANYLLREAALDESPRGRQLRRFGEAIVDSFLRLNMSPPVGRRIQSRRWPPGLCDRGQ